MDIMEEDVSALRPAAAAAAPPPPRRERGMMGSTSRRFASAMRSGGALLDLDRMGGMAPDEKEAENGRWKLQASAEDRRRTVADIMVSIVDRRRRSLCVVLLLCWLRFFVARRRHSLPRGLVNLAGRNRQ